MHLQVVLLALPYTDSFINNQVVCYSHVLCICIHYNFEYTEVVCDLFCLFFFKMSLVMRKPVFGVSDQVRQKPGCTATEDCNRLETLYLGRRGIVKRKHRLFFSHMQKPVFLQRGSNISEKKVDRIVFYDQRD